MLTVINGDQRTPLDDGSLCVLVGYDGWGASPCHRLSSRGPQQHGDTDRGFRLDPRIGRLVLQFDCTELPQMYAKRTELLRLFAPQNSPVLEWVFASGATRNIACVYAGDMTMPWEPGDWAAPKIAVSLKASDPTFYDPTEVTASWSLPTTVGFRFPFHFPFMFGSDSISAVLSITYAGSWLTYPIIEITGPLENARIENLTTGEELDFAGYSIAAGEMVAINTAYGYKTAENNFGTNLIDKLTDPNDLATFHIEASSVGLPSQVNDIVLSGVGYNSALTSARVRYYTRHTGI